MRFSLLILALALSAGAVQAQDPPTSPVEDETEVEGVVVPAPRRVVTLPRRGPASSDPFIVFRDHCFDSNRLKGRSALPIEDPAWKPLQPPMRRKLKISDPTAVAYGRLEPGLALVLKIEERPYRKRVVQHRCSLTIAGQPDQAKLVRRMSKLFDGQGTEHHIDHPNAPGYKPVPGWRQWLWSSVPERGSTNWDVFKSYLRHPRPGGGFAVIAGNVDRFFGSNTYVAGELKYNEDPARPISILSLTHTYKR